MKEHVIVLWVAALMILAATVMFVTAGPIKGLVDVSTGQEVVNADARYVQIVTTNSSASFTNLYVMVDASNATDVVNWQTMTNYIVGLGHLTTNDSPSMAVGTQWTFALADVTNNATAGTDVVNWQTMTNYVTVLGTNYSKLNVTNIFTANQTITGTNDLGVALDTVSDIAIDSAKAGTSAFYYYGNSGTDTNSSSYYDAANTRMVWLEITPGVTNVVYQDF